MTRRELPSIRYDETGIFVPHQYYEKSGLDIPLVEDVFYPANPLGDELLGNESSYDETNEIIEARLHAIQLTFREPESSFIARTYGIEKPPAYPVERFLSYTELLDEYRVKNDSNLAHAERYRAEYESEKEIISRQRERKQITGKQYRKAMDTLQQQKLATANGLIEESQHAKNAEALILRKAVLEFFSINQYGIRTGSSSQTSNSELVQNLPSLIAKIRSATTDQNNTENPLINRRPIDYLIQGMSRHLRTTTDKREAAEFKYHLGQDGLIDPESPQVLQTFVQMAFSSHRFSDDEQTQQLISQLGNSLLIFLRNRATRTDSRISTGDQYPTLQFNYDLLMCSLLIGKTSVSLQVGKYIDESFGHQLNGTAKQDIVRMLQKYMKKCKDFSSRYPEFAKEKAHINLLDILPGGNNTLVDDLASMFSSPEWRLLHGLSLLPSMKEATSSEFDSPFGKNKTLNQMGEIMRREMLRRYSPDEISLKEFLSINVTKMSSSRLLDGKCITSLVDLMTRTLLYDRQAAQAIQNKLGKGRSNKLSRTVEDAYDKDTVHEEHGLDSVLTAFVRAHWPYLEFNNEAIEQMERENETLWSEVLDNQIWFVSPRGDRFNDEDDPELATKQISHIRFDIDAAHPREHIVSLGMKELPEPVQLWLDSKRNILSQNREILKSDSRVKQTMLNMLLKRLFYITSGLLSEPQGERSERGEGSSEVDIKRAHYRILTSTDTRPITMTSHGAQIHAQEILTEYGINIFEEIRRRRGLGRLSPSQFLTYVRATLRRAEDRSKVPNIIDFDPLEVQWRLEELGISLDQL